MGPVDHSLQIKRDGISILMMCWACREAAAKPLPAASWPRCSASRACSRCWLRPTSSDRRPSNSSKLSASRSAFPVYSEDPGKSSPLQVCRNAVADAKKRGNVKVIILDTAGRLHVDDDLMRELELIDSKVGPDQALLVCDAMTGQDAVRSAKAFNDALELDGVILTKLDGDTRGSGACAPASKPSPECRLNLSASASNNSIGSKNSIPTAWLAASWAAAIWRLYLKRPSYTSSGCRRNAPSAGADGDERVHAGESFAISSSRSARSAR